ncbi:hypothetical protein DMC30DRAFT_376855 [Rhodotorula diobovata]|uniref:Mmc1 C-terminal domain-containing protein n=1 Tax=Rhodotorula diobovata TaxID=5288 RepID=A0A5C5FX94_9BASI|nr:hypothetical protein DMC30DRAFT_376855 [Rhodotorula diobovata]
MLARLPRRALPTPRCTTAPLARLLPSSSRRLASSKSTAPAHHDTAHLLRDLRTSLERYPLVDPAWSTRIDHALVDLEHPRPARLAVVGDHASDPTGLVTALLDDPLASNPDVTVALEARRLTSAAPEAITIKHGQEVHSTPDELTVPANWLHETNAEVVEIVHGEVAPLESSVTTLHLSDLVVLVLSDSTLLSSKPAQTLLYNLASKPNLLLALNCPDASPSTSSSPLRTLEHQLKALFPAAAQAGTEPRAIAVSTAQALAALEALSPSEPDQPPAYDAFQKGYVASHVPHLHQLLTSALTSSHADPPAPTRLQLETAQYVLSAALSRSAFAGAQVADALNEADAALSALEAHTSEAERALLASLGVEPSTGLLRVPPAELHTALSALDDLFATRLAWYKLPARVDDLAAEVALVASETFLPRFERHLAFSAGLAASTAAALSTRVDALFLATPQFALSPTREALSPPARLASLYSATLLNALDKAAKATTTPTDPEKDAAALSGAVAHRRAQLTAPGCAAAGPTATLHRRAQRAVLRAGTLATVSVGGAIAADVLGWAAAQGGSSAGAGLLGVTVAAWGLQRAWGRAVRRFREDVARVVGGVEEDAGVRARGVAERAAWKSRVAVRLGRERVRERRREWEEWREEWGRIEERARRLRGGEEVEAEGQGSLRGADRRRAEA